MQVKDTLWVIEKELSIAPALEIIFKLKGNSQAGEIYDGLFPLLQELEAIPFSDEKCITVLSHDKDQGGWPGAMTQDLWQQILEEMKAVSARKIRKKQTVLKISLVEELTANYIDNLAISLSQNTFPDQACVISVQISTSKDNAWEHLQRIRESVIEKLGTRFFWASLGYKFVMNPFARKSSTDMMYSCMRYSGADLHDVVCVKNGWWWNKLRTVNWQTTLNTVDPLIDGWDAIPEIVNYRTGEYPSICDRNSADPANAVAIYEYKAMAVKLSPLILMTEDMVWSVNWESDIYARWANRWEAIQPSYYR